VLVHGLQGHPKDTWTYKCSDASSVASSNKSSKSDRIRGKLDRMFTKKSSSVHLNVPETAGKNVFWPKDLLANDLKNARIIT
jgi:hypothetical protein